MSPLVAVGHFLFSRLTAVGMTETRGPCAICEIDLLIYIL